MMVTSLLTRKMESWFCLVLAGFVPRTRKAPATASSRDPLANR
jgi:hypothetical protein